MRGQRFPRSLLANFLHSLVIVISILARFAGDLTQMEGRQLGDDYYCGPAEEDEGGRRLSSSSAPRESSSRSISSSVSSSFSSSRLESFEYSGGYPPHCECEEIPSMRWLTRSFGWTPSRRSRRRSTKETRSPLTNVPPPAAGSKIHVAAWEERLPPEYETRALATQSISLDKITGKTCCMISAMDLDISPISILESSPMSRFSRVARITESERQISIVAKMGVRELSPGTTYAAYLVFESSFLKSPSHPPLTASFKVGDQFISGRRVWLQPEEVPCHFSEMTKAMGSHGWMKKVGDFVVDVGEQPWPGEPRQRTDGWMDVALGDFFVDRGNKKEMVIMRLDTYGVTVGELVVEGIEVRPKYDHGNGEGPAAPWKLSRRDPLFFPSTD